MIEMEIFRIRMDDRRGDQLIVLREKNGKRLLPIVIGIFEADAIRRKVSGVKLPRPFTHDLLCNTIIELGAIVEMVIIDSLSNGTFFAKLVLSNNGKKKKIDARPSDAIALALRADAPIYVEEKVLVMATTG